LKKEPSSGASQAVPVVLPAAHAVGVGEWVQVGEQAEPLAHVLRCLWPPGGGLAAGRPLGSRLSN